MIRLFVAAAMDFGNFAGVDHHRHLLEVLDCNESIFLTLRFRIAKDLERPRHKVLSRHHIPGLLTKHLFCGSIGLVFLSLTERVHFYPVRRYHCSEPSFDFSSLLAGLFESDQLLLNNLSRLLLPVLLSADFPTLSLQN